MGGAMGGWPLKNDLQGAAGDERLLRTVVHRHVIAK